MMNLTLKCLHNNGKHSSAVLHVYNLGKAQVVVTCSMQHMLIHLMALFCCISNVIP